MHGKKLYIILILTIFKLGLIGRLNAEIIRIDIESGLPIGEALYTLIVKKCRMVATPLTFSKGLERADTFILKDKEADTLQPKDQIVLYVESKASRQGGTYIISRISTFKLKEMDQTSAKTMVFFKSFDLEKLEGNK
jgi:hypothetical protein